ncbi:MAG: signal peptidase I [Gammaproteobacteria bacterium]|nr:signal peptidase I [Gammaproteobacteria bacterium]
MDIDFPLVLTWAVLICGALWLFDTVVLRPRRRRAAESLETSGAGAEQVERALTEPRLVEYARSFFPVLLVVLLLRSFLAEPYQIPSESMLPNLQVGDFILVNKYAYGLRLPVLGTKIFDVGEPQRGDVMVFIPPHDPRYFIKRVIGLPGDHIRYENQALYINGERAGYELIREFEAHLPTLSESVPIREYAETLNGHTHRIYRYPLRHPVQEWQVPEGAYFMMGDNRGRSEDSRSWGFASETRIVGKAVAVWMHKEPGLALPTFSRNRWLD